MMSVSMKSYIGRHNVLYLYPLSYLKFLTVPVNKDSLLSGVELSARQAGIAPRRGTARANTRGKEGRASAVSTSKHRFSVLNLNSPG